MYTSTSTADHQHTVSDSIVESVINKYKQRSKLGIEKYGVTMDRNDLSDIDWLTHAQEEALDLSLYLEKMIVRKKIFADTIDWLEKQIRNTNMAELTTNEINNIFASARLMAKI
jgi:hypothetical protein